MSERKRHIIFRLVGYAIPFMLVAYVLSIGPFSLLMTIPLDNGQETIFGDEYETLDFSKTFYAPIMYVSQRNKFVEYIIIEYIDFCCSFV
ncbi:hypothetical protein V144x_28460 [Gimesia aquarii]|uniref:Uncharacterized protein n=1 Tax=Gimesia aquarii TaxID=2527964 RepID=A0A517VWJ2_9PLAN|nr:hypothetical protein V144x_28460 [Gimesia aquarii]